MSANRESIYQFLQFCDRHIQGRKRSDAQNFLNEFFKAFGHEVPLERGQHLNYRFPKRVLKVISVMQIYGGRGTVWRRY